MVAKFTHLLTTILQIAHKRLLHAVEFRQLNVDSLASPLQILGTLSKVLSTFDTSRSYCESTLVEDN